MAIYEQRMHAGRQARSVTLAPEIQTVFLYPQRQSRRPRQDLDQPRVGSVAENAGM